MVGRSYLTGLIQKILCFFSRATETVAAMVIAIGRPGGTAIVCKACERNGKGEKRNREKRERGKEEEERKEKEQRSEREKGKEQ